jgi:acetyl-CoA carboxylase biotin carboxyl carrier protein
VTVAVDLDQLRQILDLIKEHALSEFEIEQEGLRLRVRKGLAEPVVQAAPAVPAIPAEASARATTPPPAVVGVVPLEEQSAETDVELAVMTSPIVGTFYRAAEPGAEPFVEIGATVKKGQVLCIIEAMKLMNEIDSEYDGEVVNIYVENGHPVQYGERLFAIRIR